MNKTTITIVVLSLATILSVILHNNTSNKLQVANIKAYELEKQLDKQDKVCTQTISEVRKAQLGQVLNTQASCQESLNGIIKFINK